MDEVARVEAMAKAMRRHGIVALALTDMTLTLGPPPTERDRLAVEELPPATRTEKERELAEADAKRARREELELELASAGVPVTDELAKRLGVEP